jgi:hypothetical protein
MPEALALFLALLPTGGLTASLVWMARGAGPAPVHSDERRR